MRPVHALILIAPLLLAGKCQGPQVNVREACGVLRATLYQDGQFMFTDAEMDALREINQVKIVAVKNFYLDKCLGKKP